MNQFVISTEAIVAGVIVWCVFQMLIEWGTRELDDHFAARRERAELARIQAQRASAMQATVRPVEWP